MEGSDRPAVTFRKACIRDLDAIVKLLLDDPLGKEREIADSPPADVYIRAFETIDADPNQLIVVAERAYDIVGTLQLSFIPGIARRGAWRGQIEGVRIAATQRGSGLGREMLEWAITTCRQRDCRLVQLTADKSRLNAHRFYESLGFVASHRGYKLNLE
ncbi:GNAT family N-acetyltransferase [Microbacteriaceae bacterium K1510]|nr:GNAT family N-acetyltransferase [Microbacteriaceae bacterium K1510]